MQKWLCVLVVWLVQGNAMAQDSSNAAVSSLPEWRAADYDQAQKIFSGIYLTPIDNPALAGFDRQLVATYGGGVKNINVGGQFVDDAPTPAFWSQRAMLDFAFGGKRKNVGVALMYQSGREYKSDFHVFGIAHSYRFHIRKHRLTFGLGMHLTSQTLMNIGVFGNSISPYNGFIYTAQDRDFSQTEPLQSTAIHSGMLYDFKRLFFSYSFRFGVQIPATSKNTGVLPVAYSHTISLGYHFKLPANLTLSPMLLAEHVWERWQWNPTITFTWKDQFTLGISAPYLSQVRLDVGGQFWNRFRISASVAFYHQEFMQKLNGMAYAGGSLRYMLPLWKK
jgi:hypothetical protein